MKPLLRIIIIFLILPAVALADNVKLRVFIIGDTNDNSIGQSVSADIRSYKKLISDIQEAVKSEGVTTTVDVYTGNNCSYDKLDAYLDNLSCRNDIILFIYNGHGGRSHQDQSKFPRMCLGSNYVDKWMKVSDLNDRLRAKNPRLMVVMTDCCNSYYDRRSGGKENAYGLTSGTAKGDGFRELFLHNKGEVCITGSSPGEYGWGANDGGIFSLNALDMFYDFDSKGSDADWNSLMQAISDKTYNHSLSYYKRHTISNTQRPVFDVKVTKAGLDSGNNDSGDNGDTGATDIDWGDGGSNPNNGNSGSSHSDDWNYDDDELYEDEDVTGDEDGGMDILGALWNSIWVVLFGILLVKVPDILSLEGGLASIFRIIGTVVILWAVISFIISL